MPKAPSDGESSVLSSLTSLLSYEKTLDLPYYDPDKCRKRCLRSLEAYKNVIHARILKNEEFFKMIDDNEMLHDLLVKSSIIGDADKFLPNKLKASKITNLHEEHKTGVKRLVSSIKEPKPLVIEPKRLFRSQLRVIEACRTLLNRFHKDESSYSLINMLELNRICIRALRAVETVFKMYMYLYQYDELEVDTMEELQRYLSVLAAYSRPEPPAQFRLNETTPHIHISYHAKAFKSRRSTWLRIDTDHNSSMASSVSFDEPDQHFHLTVHELRESRKHPKKRKLRFIREYVYMEMRLMHTVPDLCRTVWLLVPVSKTTHLKLERFDQRPVVGHGTFLQAEILLHYFHTNATQKLKYHISERLLWPKDKHRTKKKKLILIFREINNPTSNPWIRFLNWPKPPRDPYEDDIKFPPPPPYLAGPVGPHARYEPIPGKEPEQT